jgi:hypothetical protein
VVDILAAKGLSGMGPKKKRKQWVTRLGIVVSAFLLSSLAVAWTFISPTHFFLLNKGPMTAGHEALACTSCHDYAPGSTRQQFQAIVASWMGMRNDEVDFALRPPQNSDCVDCHDRANDRHPVHRFKEPRFLQSLEVVDARSCMGCHTEHSGARVSNNGEYCVACHKDMTIKKDPITPPHIDLAHQGRWESCLQCHDFHNNHKYRAPKDFSERIDLTTVKNYLRDMENPYGAEKVVKAKKER